MTDERPKGAAGGGYWNPDPAGPARHGLVAVQVRGLDAFDLVTESHTFSPTRLDPGTRLLLEAIVAHYAGQNAQAPGRVADLGAGYGPIGLALARRFPDAAVDLFEQNARAARAADANARRLGLANASLLVGDVADLWGGRPPYDLIATNPPIRAGRDVYTPWLRMSRSHLRLQGSFWFVCRTAQGAQSLTAILADALDDVTVVARQSGYRVVRGLRAQS